MSGSTEAVRGSLTPTEIRALEAVFEADPKNRRALLTLAGHHLETDATDAVDRLLARYLRTVSGGPAALQVLLRSAASPTPTVRAGLLLRLALLQRDQYGDGRGARQTVQTALKVEPDLDAAQSLLELLRGDESGEHETQIGVQALGFPAEAPDLDDDPGDPKATREFVTSPEIDLGAGPIPFLDPGAVTTLAPLDDETGERTEATPFAEANPEIVRACDQLLASPLGHADRTSALHTLERAQESGADRAAVHQALSRAYEASGDRDRAFYSLVRAARLAIPARRVLDELFRLAMLTGAFSELSAVYEDNLGGPLSPPDRTYLHLKLGHLYSRELARPDAARAHYERVLQIDASRLEALARLAELHTAAGRFRELARVRERELALARAASDLAAAARARRELARLYEEHLDAPQKALEHYQAILAVLPENAAALQGLARLAAHSPDSARRQTAVHALRASLEAAGRWEELAALLAEQAAALARAQEPAQAVRAYLDAASIQLHRRGDASAALIELMRATRAHRPSPVSGDGTDPDPERPREDEPTATRAAPGPSTAELLEALLTAGRAASSLGQALAVAEDLLARVPDEEAATLSLRLVELELEELDRPDAAVDRAIALLEKSDDPRRWTGPLESRFIAKGHWAPLARLYTGALPRVEPAIATELSFRLAEIQESELDDRLAARETYGRLLERAPTSLAALDAFERLCVASGDQSSARRMLAQLLALEADAETGEPSDALRVEWHLRRARLLTDAGDEAGARADFSAILDLDPQQVEALEGLAESARSGAELHARAAALEARLRRLAPGAEGRAEGFRHLAGLLGPGRGAESSGERAAWETVREELPTDREAFEGLRRAYRAADEQEALAALLKAQIEATPRDESARAWRRELSLSLRKLGRASEIVTVWEQAVQTDAADTEALAELVAHHTARKQWDEVARLLEAWLEAETDRDRKADLWVQLARIRGPIQDDPDGARTALERALAQSPSHEAAFTLLVGMLRDSGALRKHFALLDDRLAHTTHPTERAPLLRELWEVGQALRSDGVVEAGLKATEALEELALSLPEDDELWEALREAMAGPALAVDLGGLLEARAARLEGRRRARALADAAQVWNDAVGRMGPRAFARARRCLERARDASSIGDAVALEVRQALRQIYANAGAFEALAAVLEEIARDDLGADDATRASALEELAYTLEERLERPAEAAGFLQKMMALSPDEAQEEQLLRLGNLQANLGRWDEVYDLLLRRLRLPHAQADEKALRLQAATVGWKRLGAPEKAIAHLRAALALEPDDEGTLASLEQACIAADRVGEFAGILSEEAALTRDTARRADRLVRAGAIKERQVGDLAGARRDYEAALEVAPEPGDLRDAARDGLARTLSAQADFPALAELYRGWIDDVRDPPVRSDLCLALGLIHEEQLDDPERALASYRRALEFDPEDVGILDAIARVAEARDDLETALLMRTRQAAEVEAPAPLAALFTHIGHLQKRLDDEAGAVDAYRRAIALDPDSLAAPRALFELISRRGGDSEGIDIARALAKATDDESERAELWTWIGLAHERAGTGPEALAAFEQALTAQADHPEAALGAARHRGPQAPREALALLDGAIARLAEAGRVDPLVEALSSAAILASDAGEADTARTYLERALRQTRPGAKALGTLAAALEQLGNHEAAARTWAQLCADALAGQKITPHLRRGQCLLALGRADDALDALRGAINIDPGDVLVLETLADAFEAAGRWEEVVEVLATLRALEDDPRRARNATMEMAEICATQLADAERAAAVLEEGLARSPDDPEILDRLVTEEIRAGQLASACAHADRLLERASGIRARGRAALRVAALRARLPGRESEVPPLLREALGEASGVALRDEALLLGKSLAAKTHDVTFLATVIETRLQTEHGTNTEASLLRELAAARHLQNDLDGAMAALEASLAIEPDVAEAIEALARHHEAAGNDQKALQTFRRLLQVDPSGAPAREGLRRAFEATGHEDGANLALAVEGLVAGSPAPTQQVQAAANALEVSALAATASLDTMTRTQGLYPEAMRGLAGELARALGYEGTRAALQLLGDRPTRELPPPGDLPPGPLGETLAWAAERLGVELPPLALAPTTAARALTPCREAPGLLLFDPERAAALSPGELRFLAGQALLLCRPRSMPAVALDPMQIRSLFEAAILMAGSEKNRGGDDEAARLSRALIEALPPARHPPLVRAATRFRAEAQLPVAGYYEAVHQAALRAGLLLAGNPLAAARVLGTGEKAPRAALHALSVFALSAEHLELRVRLGMARS